MDVVFPPIKISGYAPDMNNSSRCSAYSITSVY